MKKLISMLTALTLVIAMFCACSSPEEEKKPQDNNKQTINEPSSKEDSVDKEKPVVEEEKPVSSKETVKEPVKEPVKEDNSKLPMGGGALNIANYRTGISNGFTAWYSDLDPNFMNWALEFGSPQIKGTRDSYDYSLILFINERNISKEAFIAATKEARKFYASINSDYRIYGILTDEEIEIIFSKDMKKINQTFVNPYAILVDDKIYSPKWINEHSIKECEAVGITKEMLAEKLPEWEEVSILANNKLTELKSYANAKK